LAPDADTAILPAENSAIKQTERSSTEPGLADDELLHAGTIFRVVRRNWTLPDGRRGTKECVLHPGAVAVVPLLDDDRVCLIRNHRVTVEQTLIEIPAGTLEAGEAPEVCAARELQEETGYTADTLERLATLFMSPGILHERMHVFVATGLRAGATDLQAGEEIENLVLPWHEAVAMVERGEIVDGKTVAALLLVDRRRKH
jgi:ADP-ribose pyrophosphatase